MTKAINLYERNCHTRGLRLLGLQLPAERAGRGAGPFPESAMESTAL
jgi:hypothetical protein